jgi:6,7-dimethyl-8-ribityllumazine synthase
MSEDKGIGIIAAEFNKDLIDAMVSIAEEALSEAGVKLVRTIRVPGCYEVPLVADHEMARNDIEALVVLGYIERGETLHGEVMGNVVHGALIELELKYHKAIGIGIIGPGATPEQAQKRFADYSRSAVQAALRVKKIIEG